MNRKLTKEQEEIFEHLSSSEIAELLPDLYFWDAVGLGDVTVSELISLINKVLEESRREAKP